MVNYFNITMGCIVGIVFFSMGTLVGRVNFTPKTATISNDFNKDGIADMLIKTERNHNIPMYGIKKDNYTYYVSGEEIKKMFPDSIVDYKGIEDKLNGN